MRKRSFFSFQKSLSLKSLKVKSFLRPYNLWPVVTTIILISIYPIIPEDMAFWIILIPLISFFYYHVSWLFWFSFFFIFSLVDFFSYKAFFIPWPFQFIPSLNFFFTIVMGYVFFRLVRPYLFSFFFTKLVRRLKLLPKISQTEQEAIQSGDVWVEKHFFSGRPNFTELLTQPFPELTKEEQDFLNNETETLCEICNEWEIEKKKTIPDEVHNFINKNHFLGMIIPKSYGGLGFSPSGHAQVIQKIASVDIATSIFVMVPNSLGPAELLLHYGTQEQKDRYLSKLAVGEELPCFGLTEPQAGSDAGSIVSEGVLFRGDDGRLKIRLQWNKRWISLSAIATLLGIAFKLKDPDRLLGGDKEIGITCALVPHDTPGVLRGEYHDPMGVPFYNAPIQGENVVIDAEEYVIGGLKQAGKGWRMLVECLGVGRGISLPSQTIGGMRRTLRLVGNHASVRNQFGIPIGRFEGIQEPLARILGCYYNANSCENYTLSALNQGLNPSVATAIVKCNVTEMGRKVTNDAMDIMGGAGLTLGPKNFLANIYKATPISITVEGANILTRSLIIYGQGSLRAHPYIYQEILALESGDFKAFDTAFGKHIYHFLSNTVRIVLLSITRGWSHINIQYFGKGHRYIQKLTWSSAILSWLTDLSLFIYGGNLKIKEYITGRFSDILSYQYISTAVLWHWHYRGSPKKEWPIVKWCLEYNFDQIQKSIEGILSNLRFPVLKWTTTGLLYFVLRLNALGRYPSDRLSRKISKLLMDDSDIRKMYSKNLYENKDTNSQFQKLERAYRFFKEAEGVNHKIKQAIKKKLLPKKPVRFLIEESLKQGIITQEESQSIQKAVEARWEAIQVDSFPKEEYLSF